ncbi:MAG: hypothetical protein CSB47_04160 [Proteobacteria bacterium]|nr:MAG: hypothetical protein CSB47_04160 [Pseudomonadota bacterium]
MTSQPVYSANLDNHAFLDWLSCTFPRDITDTLLLINIDQQRLYHLYQHTLLQRYPISSAANGVGSQSGSGQTPLGAHKVQEKYGASVPIGGILKGRVYTGEIATILQTRHTSGDTDNITSRILWLSGLEDDKNRGGNVDSYQRYIYIHGTDEEGWLGQPVSHGCIRMANHDISALFADIENNTFVYIYPE